MAAIAALALLAACDPAGSKSPPGAPAADATDDDRPPLPEPPGAFDFYVLSLSWSPSYCEAEGERANRQQCAEERDLGFVTHGLWPQHERGWPEYCASREPDRVPDALVARYLDLIPSAGLIGHQWRKHGTCTGLAQTDYLATVRAARNAVSLPAALADTKARQRVDPDEVERDFLAANPGLAADGIAVTCESGLLREVRICLTKALAFRACPEVDRRACRAPGTDMPAP